MLKKILCGATLLCAAGFSNAAVVSFSDTVDLQTTNFADTAELARFDTMGGTRVLESVTFTIDGSISGSVEVESRDAEEAVIVTTLEAELSLIDALGNVLVVTIPSISETFTATAYDGSLDFGGTSGQSYLDLFATQSGEETYTDAATLAFFSGAGNAEFVFDAMATSSATGAGNITSAINTNASGLVTVSYTYTDVTPNPVSAPTHVALLGLGLLTFAGFRKSRK
jgi:hypothetical protein